MCLVVPAAARGLALLIAARYLGGGKSQISVENHFHCCALWKYDIGTAGTENPGESGGRSSRRANTQTHCRIAAYSACDRPDAGAGCGGLRDCPGVLTLRSLSLDTAFGAVQISRRIYTS